MTEFSLPIRVYLEDTDAGGIVYYVNYLKYMERSRTEWLRTTGFDFNSLIACKLQFVVHSLQADYRLPAKMDDELSVTTTLEKVARTYILFEQEVRRQASVLCSAKVKVACICSETLKPKPMPHSLFEAKN